MGRLFLLLVVIILTWSGTPDRGKKDVSWLALGDSYTIGTSVDSRDRYPVQAARLLGDSNHLSYNSPDIIAHNGWTTEDLLAALTLASPPPTYQVVTLLIGVNNQYQARSLPEYREQFRALLELSIRLAGGKPSHVLVLSIPDYSITPFARGRQTALIAARIDAFNRVNHEVSLDYKVHYLDITATSRQAAGDLSFIASDGLHFSGKEYAIWAHLMEPLLKEMIH